MFRAEDAAHKTAKSIEALGHEAVLAPVTRIVACDIVAPPGHLDAILATSVNAFAPSSLAGLLHLPVFVVGKTTGEAARRRGFRDIRTSTGDASALVALLRLTLPRPARLLYLAGRDRKPTLEHALADAGYGVEIALAYEADAVSRWPDDVSDALKAGRLDIALHFSRRSAELALDLARHHDALAAFLALEHDCLSDDVAAPLRAAGASSTRVAPRLDKGSLLSLLPPHGR